ncbi:lipopolysaccharide biosynthesis protein [Ihubacter massiliensis]|uniref:Lipopolysaccharide biosynthesis protein n=1 Tax=Hominibacterium faecale TaxID=2839743 RepID=A0A9J6QY25_9FIRM|nr:MULTISPECIES: lipopolysaccharide biosynthesis protein [Eubacteriales Family XIII. Incertae Sedis]MCO7123756.1 lipopolysaccharide biosynthesis protein [Ihubacter massiliensis]MCU7380411.1 lipopolysaccharide biosynthesis protein [Hominibacterium faecale]
MWAKKDTIKNSIANITSKFWSIVAIYFFIPFYINILGEEAYGLVSFFATLQAAMNILGLGLANTLRREFAIGDSKNDNVNIRKYKLLKSTELIYFMLAILVVAICFLGSHTIADQWFSQSSLGQNIIAVTLVLMGGSIALQFLTNMYHGCILGLGNQITANAMYIGWSAIKNIGALVVICIIAPDIRVFYVWHIISDLIYLVILRIYVVHKLNSNKRLEWKLQDFKIMKSILPYTAGILIISIIALINKQMDKIIISKYMSLEELGAYNSAFLLGQLITIVSSAVSVALFSYYTQMFSKGDISLLRSKFLYDNKLITIIIACLGVYIAVFAPELLMFWTKSNIYVSIIEHGVFFIVMGSLFLALQEIPYAFVLAQGNTKINIQLGLFSLPFTIVGMVMAVKSYGVTGASIFYFLLMVSSTLIYICIIYKKYFGKWNLKVLFIDIVMPITICLGIAIVSRIAIKSLLVGLVPTIIAAIFCGAVNLIVMLLSIKSIRRVIKTKLFP